MHDTGPKPVAARVYAPPGVRISRGTPWAAGIDLFVDRPVLIPAGGQVVVDTGQHWEIPEGNFGLLKERSSLALDGIMVLGGVIDSDYRGPIKVIMRNLSSRNVGIPVGKAVAQMVVLPYTRLEPVCVGSLSELAATARGGSGFGSTNGARLAGAPE